MCDLWESHAHEGPDRADDVEVAPALANAVHDATGVRYRALPLTPERVYGRLPAEQSVPAG
ncbi:hypothetical protein ABZ372_20985 [Streptomyces sp. NPDC005921]